MKTRKGQGISINVIIIAAIALAVLVVLFAIFTGRLSLFGKGLREGETAATQCVCAGPQVKGTCSESAPATGSEQGVPSGCVEWTDCPAPLKCYKG